MFVKFYFKRQINIKQGPAVSDSSLHLVVWWQCFAQVDPHSQAKLFTGMFLMKLLLQLETLLPIKTVHGSKGQWFFFQEALQSCTPGLKHGAAGLRGNVRWSPEDLRGQNLKATVVQDAILQR